MDAVKYAQRKSSKQVTVKQIQILKELREFQKKRLIRYIKVITGMIAGLALIAPMGNFIVQGVGAVVFNRYLDQLIELIKEYRADQNIKDLSEPDDTARRNRLSSLQVKSKKYIDKGQPVPVKLRDEILMLLKEERASLEDLNQKITDDAAQKGIKSLLA